METFENTYLEDAEYQQYSQSRQMETHYVIHDDIYSPNQPFLVNKVSMEPPLESFNLQKNSMEESTIECKLEEDDGLDRLLKDIKQEFRKEQPFKATPDQECFLLSYVDPNSLARLKSQIDDEIINGPETQSFLCWLNHICK